VCRFFEPAQAFITYKPTLFDRVKIFLFIVVCIFTLLPIMILKILWDMLRTMPVWFRKTHIQIGTTCYVWGSGLSGGKNKETIPLSNFKNDKRFVVKYYKYFSIVGHA
jgi:hypothetical protein